MPVWVWHSSLIQVQTLDRLGMGTSLPLISTNLLWNTLICVHISVEIQGRRTRAFSRAMRSIDTSELACWVSNI